MDKTGHVLFIGPPWVDKTTLAIGLSHAAIDAGHRVSTPPPRTLWTAVPKPRSRDVGPPPCGYSSPPDCSSPTKASTVRRLAVLSTDRSRCRTDRRTKGPAAPCSGTSSRLARCRDRSRPRGYSDFSTAPGLPSPTAVSKPCWGTRLGVMRYDVGDEVCPTYPRRITSTQQPHSS
jgi:hypothetical protein